ncbi:isoprenylcysteine carboxylmethyltransferase family protein [Mycobacterium sp. URHB0044]|uniref:methyltransferase family protein n=1 Tax=Mycobacterium sp. URHB0044 TaxID=1380386 RepID=UPI00048C9770|nr:isoprenylcysteine carboxylmethyltransferase family protein [Mycobacterium sp. URHB0044]
MKPLIQAAAASAFGLAFFGALLFGPAGTFDYWQAWVFIGVFTAVSLSPTVYWAMRRPDVFARRLRSGPLAETRPMQKIATVGVYVVVVAMAVVSALDHRFGWSHVPTPVVVVGNVLVAFGLGMSMLVVGQNEFAAATVTVEAEQPVVDTGLYAVVRHPMYVGALIMMAGMPLALDSYWGLATVVPGVAVLALRTVDEEKMLRDDLLGYDEYTEKVRYRLVPGVW